MLLRTKGYGRMMMIMALYGVGPCSNYSGWIHRLKLEILLPSLYMLPCEWWIVIENERQQGRGLWFFRPLCSSMQILLTSCYRVDNSDVFRGEDRVVVVKVNTQTWLLWYDISKRYIVSNIVVNDESKVTYEDKALSPLSLPACLSPMWQERKFSLLDSSNPGKLGLLDIP